MRKISKAIIYAITITLLVTSFALPVRAKAGIRYRHETEAWILNRLGLFAGASVNSFFPDLGAQMDRQIGITLLLNFFGKRSEVEKLSANETDKILNTFIDEHKISFWARPYLAYAVKNGIVVGTSKNTISPDQKIDSTSFAALILRQLGYTADRNNFSLSINNLYKYGGINSSEVDYFNKSMLYKDDAVGMAYSTLYAQCANGKTLIEELAQKGVINVENAVNFNLLRYKNPNEVEVVKPRSGIVRPGIYELIYYTIMEALLNSSAGIAIPITPFTDTSEEVFALVEKCVRDNPFILYYSGCTYYYDGRLTFKYSKSINITQLHRAKLEDKVNSIINEIIRPDMTDYEKELAVHSYIIENCEYDRSREKNITIPPESFSAYGALCMGVSVCEGYSEACKLLLDRAGVDCQVICGTSRGSGHAWNIVKINGQYYHLDVTWDDPITKDGTNLLTYRYFNLNDKEMAKDHSWDKNIYPACTDTEFNYYVYNDLIVSDKNQFIDFAVAKYYDGLREITVKVSDINFKCNEAVKELCDRLYKGCTYTWDEIHNIIDLFFK